MTEEYIVDFMALFKIEGIMDRAMHALQLFLQKYSTFMDWDDWENLADDIDFVGPVDDIPLFALQYQLAVHVQNKKCMGVMTNGGHHTSKGVLVGGGAGRRLMRCILRMPQPNYYRKHLITCRFLREAFCTNQLLLTSII
jgi:hypothetical protein